jgi:hypothetical protein
MYNSKAIKARPGACTAVLDANRDDPAFKVYTRQNLDGSTELEDMPLNVREMRKEQTACGWDEGTCSEHVPPVSDARLLRCVGL